MKIDFEGKVILVTGSSRGIGKTVADKIEKSGGIIIRTNSKNLNFLESSNNFILSKKNPVRV